MNNYESAKRTEDINSLIYNRHKPSIVLPPKFDIRPVSTKYSYMPIFDRRSIPTESLAMPVIQNTLVPGVSTHGPWDGFASNINTESQLRSQCYPLQRGYTTTCFIPSSQSELYHYIVQDEISSQYTQPQQPHQLLFESVELISDNIPIKNTSGMFFNVSTRYEFKEDKRAIK